VQSISRYESRLLQVGELLAANEQRSSLVSKARIGLFLLAGGTLIAMVWGPGVPFGGAIIAILFILFVVLVVVHARLFEAAEGLQIAKQFFVRGLLRAKDKWRETPVSSLKADVTEHDYADDLDVLGAGGLAHLLPPPATPFGASALLALLIEPGRSIAVVRARQAQVKELAGHHDLRESLHVLARGTSSEKVVTEEASLAWAREKLPSLGALRILAFALPALTLGLFVLGTLGLVPSAAWSFSATFSIVVAMLLGQRLQPYFAALELGLPRYQSIFRSLEQAPLRAPELKALQAILKKNADKNAMSASEAIEKLSRVASFANARNNEIFRFVIGPVLQWDLHAALALGRVHAQLQSELPAWFAALGQFDAFSALGSYAFEHADFAWPEFVESPDFEVTALAHPLLPAASRKSNTLSLEQLHIVTGSNMAGKSTLLRAVGLATVLAYAGAPVCASKLRLGYFRVVSSMRIRDSVGDGVSRFYAELAKLKRVMSEASETQTLVLLDEILSGTNMRERVIGARGLIAELGRRNAKGLVSTHDLELTTLSGVRNVHFEEQVNGEVMTFDYTLRQGVVESGNALRLMRALGLEFPSE
jgi:hypothetical protein